MIPEIGVFALVLALLVAGTQAVLALAGAHWRLASWMRVARPAAALQALFVWLAFGCLAQAFLAGDFSVRYVASNSHSELPAIYRFTAVWGSHEGSMLLWQALLSAWTLAVALRSRALPPAFAARVLGVMGLVSVGLLLFLLLLSNPFDRLVPAPAEGRDLNPLLQDPGMVLHPPLLYMGYVGFSVAFAFGIAALLSGELNAAWARWSRPWTLAAWTFLTLGILLGSAWAYYVLGWGGWWFWDPVENASFMPWLVGTALIHSLIVSDQRGAFRGWTVMLAIAAFSLSLLGTFLVRSGVLTSVHAFAVDPGRGLYILCFMVAVVGTSLLLFAWRAPSIAQGGRFAALSRETLLLVNNVLFATAALAVLIGTLYPLLLDVLGGDKISVGPPYFQAVFVPLIVPALVLMGVGPMARWKRSTLPELRVQLRWALAASGICALLLGVLLPREPDHTWTPLSAFGLLLAAWCLCSALAQAWQRLQGDWRGRWAKQPRAWWGMLLAHAGVGVFVFGVTLSGGFESKRELSLAPGTPVNVGGFEFRLGATETVKGPNYDAQRVAVGVSRDGQALPALYPEKRVYRTQAMPMSQSAIATGLQQDLLVGLGEPLADGAWTVRIQVKPFLAWIWVGCALMALGGLLALADKRYRTARRREAAALPVSHGEPS
ncbi:heme lyase CcmF/NrfE family subunit [Roseateles sp. DXS20W]|uniref:Heme lyase CcmF/NrfE family subunit n=1 Tax=Pelomonas lactea TaxID=3299030 RepID=A0ABW7GRU7_9BURK